MEYKRTPLDLFLEQKFKGIDGNTLENNLNGYIQELELQLSEFIKQINFFDIQIATLNKMIAKGINPTTNGYYVEQKQIFADGKIIANISCFITIISADIKSAQKGLYFEKTELAKRNAAKNLCVTLYETSVDDLFDLLGKDFKDIITNRIDINPIEPELKNIRKRLNEYRNTNKTFLYDVRTNIGAHKDLNSIKQLSTIEDIDWQHIITITLEFENIINDLGAFLSKIRNLHMLNLQNSPKAKGLI